MRILYVIHQFMPEFATGTERVTMNIAKVQQRNGHYAEILTCSVRGPSFWQHEADGLRQAVVNGIRIFALPRASLGEFAEFDDDIINERTNSVISSFLDRGAYDLVHVMHPMRMLPVIKIIRDRAIPYIVTLSDYFSICYRINLKRPDDSICSGPEGGKACNAYCVGSGVTRERLAARSRRLSESLLTASDVVAPSDFVASIYRMEFPNLPIRIIAHGIDLPRFRRSRRDNEGGPIVFGYIGTLSKAKGVHVLAEAFARAAPPNAHLEIVGSAYGDDAFGQQLKNLTISTITIRDAIDHHSVPEMLAGFDILCLPSLWPETFSLALHEGFAAGLPALVSDIGWPARAVKTASCGRALAVGDVDAWSKAIAELARNPHVLRAWRDNLPSLTRIEEEGFFYNGLYRLAAASATV